MKNDLEIYNCTNVDQEVLREKIKEYINILTEENYNLSNYVITALKCQTDDLNDAGITLDGVLVCIPRKYRDTSYKLFADFSTGAFVLYDKDEDVIYESKDNSKEKDKIFI